MRVYLDSLLSDRDVGYSLACLQDLAKV
uniref:Uncharacterized protein n=1 Tax=Anguilla anguilla TaxID=7936 RepID=A0A0E9XQ64_ANGAN